MRTLPVSEVKMKLSSLVEIVRSTDEEITITRNGAPVAILISAEEFESLKETASIQKEDELMKEIKSGLNELKSKKARLYTLSELFK